mmetsp:Transcript_36655/g.85283  ORF Transcript_36655/g.85283 Transcript_36655/m.85283 type:complete len:91 (-) Transcript_36655:95-367(-)
MVTIRSFILLLAAGLLPTTEAAGVVRTARTSSGTPSGCAPKLSPEADVTGDSLVHRGSSTKHMRLELVDDEEEEEELTNTPSISGSEPAI